MARRPIESRLQRGADRDDDTCPCLRLLQPNHPAVVGVPREPQEVALPLAGPQSERKREMEVRGGLREEGGFIGC